MVDYFDLNALQAGAEPLPDGETVESADFQPVGFKTTTPGTYTSKTRKVEGRLGDNGQYYFKITFDTGLLDEAGITHNLRFPLTKTVSTTPFKEKDSQGNEQPGTTSSVARYLRKCGIVPAGPIQEVIGQMNESQAIPVGVWVGRTDRAVKNPDGSYTSANLKTKIFNSGTKAEPVWLEEVTVGGILYRAKAMVGGFEFIR